VKPHPDFDVFEYIGRLKREIRPHKEVCRGCAKDGRYSDAAIEKETVATLGYVLESLTHEAKTGEPL